MSKFEKFLGMLNALIHSRKFLLTCVAVLQTVLLNYFGIDEALWQAIDVLLMALIGSIAYEDGQSKRAEVKLYPYTEEE